MRVIVITKEFGTISTASVPFSDADYQQLKSDMESIADSVGKDSCESWSFEDDKGNTFILSPEILKKSLFVIEVNTPQQAPNRPLTPNTKDKQKILSLVPPRPPGLV